jgi:hypothetical protein
MKKSNDGSKRDAWGTFFELADQADVPEDFLSDRGDAPSQKREV